MKIGGDPMRKEGELPVTDLQPENTSGDNLAPLPGDKLFFKKKERNNGKKD